ncbi:MAG: hypothetical protein KGL39_47600 [Patescibacteria group bacterium]|nr:hypothetical protein [Patescibacteria group bacterium]
MNIALIPESELREDLAASEMDAVMCERVAPGRFRERIEVNRQIVAKIRAELERREQAARSVEVGVSLTIMEPYDSLRWTGGCICAELGPSECPIHSRDDHQHAEIACSVCSDRFDMADPAETGECPRCNGDGYVMVRYALLDDGSGPEEAEACPVCRCEWFPTDEAAIRDFAAANDGEEVVF